MLDGNDAVTSEHLVLLIGHLEEQQIRELLQVIAVGQTVVTQHIAEVHSFCTIAFGSCAVTGARSQCRIHHFINVRIKSHGVNIRKATPTFEQCRGVRSNG